MLAAGLGSPSVPSGTTENWLEGQADLESRLELERRILSLSPNLVHDTPSLNVYRLLKELDLAEGHRVAVVGSFFPEVTRAIEELSGPLDWHSRISSPEGSLPSSPNIGSLVARENTLEHLQGPLIRFDRMLMRSDSGLTPNTACQLLLPGGRLVLVLSFAPLPYFQFGVALARHETEFRSQALWPFVIQHQLGPSHVESLSVWSISHEMNGEEREFLQMISHTSAIQREMVSTLLTAHYRAIGPKDIKGLSLYCAATLQTSTSLIELYSDHGLGFALGSKGGRLESVLVDNGQLKWASNRRNGALGISKWIEMGYPRLNRFSITYSCESSDWNRPRYSLD